MTKIKKSKRTTAKYRDLPTHKARMIERRAEQNLRLGYSQRSETMKAQVARFAAHWRGVYATHGYSKAHRRALATTA
jgi:hypothetical protein